jgi:hypothetical protein
MCMKTLAMVDKMSYLQTVFWPFVHGCCEIQWEFCPFLLEIRRFHVPERPTERITVQISD